MQSFKSKLIFFTIRNRHLMKFRLKPEIITRDTDTLKLREEFERGAQKFGAVPPEIEVKPVDIDGMYAEWIVPRGAPLDKVILYTHGGGYVSGSCADHRMHVAKFVQGSGVGALLYEYRLAPEHPFPAAVEDSLKAYRWLLAQGIDPKRIVVVGESAGGGLCMALILAIRDEGLPLPAAGAALSPFLDLHCTSESFRTNEHRDISYLGSWDVWGDYYAGSSDRSHPWMSPVYGDLRGLPPLFIQVGDHEIMLDDSRIFAEKARAAGVDMTLSVWPNMVHCFAIMAPMFPEATQAMQEVCDYIRAHGNG